MDASIIELILSRSPHPYLWVLSGVAFSIGVFLVLSIPIADYTHLRSKRHLLLYWLVPFQPERMIVLGDGEDVRVYYDNEVEMEKGVDETIIRTIDGLKVHARKLEKKIISVWDAHPPRTPGPFSLAWRWLTGAMILVYMCFVALGLSYTDSRIRALEFLAETGLASTTEVAELVNQIRMQQASNIMFSAVAFAVAIAWFLAFLFNLRSRQIEYYELVLVPKEGLIYEGIPAIAAGSLESLSFLRELGKLEIRVPEALLDVFEKIKKRLGNNDEGLAAIICNRLVANSELKKELGDLHKEMRKIRRAAEARFIQSSSLTFTRVSRRNTLIIILIVMIALGIGFLSGFTLGANWHITVTPGEAQAPGAGPGGSTGPAGSGGSTSVTPAPPPPPPISVNETSAGG